LAVAERHDTRHEVLVTAWPDLPEPALWATIDLIAPIGGWRMLASEFVAARQQLRARGLTGVGQTGDEVEAAIEASLGPSVIAEWHEFGARTIWCVSSSAHDAELVATIVVAADDEHVDLWRSDLDTLRTSMLERLKTRGGKMVVNGRDISDVSGLDEVIALIAEAAATSDR
jgi:hypothetical protein